MQSDISQRLQNLRKRCGLSIRKLAELSGVTAGMISCIERNTTSPSITTLQKILSAMDLDIPSFFSTNEDHQKGMVFLREHMQTIHDKIRSYTLIFPKRENIRIELFDEQFLPGKKIPPMEKLKCDVAGYVISGRLILEIKGKSKKVLRPGDGFYIPMGQEHRGYATDEEPLRLITVYSPARY